MALRNLVALAKPDAVCRLVPSAVARSSVVSARRCFSSVTELTPEEIEEAAIYAGMAKIKAESQLVCHKGYLTMYEDDDHNLPENVVEVATLDCMPKEQSSRTVNIRQEAQHANTSGVERLRGWILDWKNTERWTNPLTGWTSSADPMTSVKLVFDTKEQAIAFCDKKGIKYDIKARAPRQREFGKNYYAHNFLPPAVETVIAQEGKATKYFQNPKADDSHYFRPLNFHGEAPCRQHGSDQLQPIATPSA
eukprot:CAMPEP_0171611682 /NCGR_PEP_ID=MMETSP0990-20121206/10771_1 /TAXON_ID=483369 /ORGANISM="non described non described, Strain CCMP2098" /LENGTH=249 /DNA_ID=CAMNT_0012175291 /DNA_START=25 /DNA_END=774 /DNA_ORIENTATION=+